MVIGSFALMGVPFLTGFYSKEIILEMSLINLGMSSAFSYWLGFFAVLTTAYYSTRALFYSLFGGFMGFKKIFHTIETSTDKNTGHFR